MNQHIEKLKAAIVPVRSQIVQHPLYAAMQQLEDVQLFTEHHVFAVWDFMSLLKGLQQQLTCVQVPWMPVGNPEVRYLINEIVTGEESDVDKQGKRGSHFELYLEAMNQMGSDTTAVHDLLNLVRNGSSVQAALVQLELPASVQAFVRFTFEVLATGKPHLVAAVFTFGREDLIPDMFLSLVRDLDTRFPDRVSVFKYYLERHIEVDGDHHSHLSMQMVSELCGDDEQKWAEATRYARLGLEQRLSLWDGVLKEIVAVDMEA